MKKLMLLCSAGLLLGGCGGEKSEYERYYEADYQPDTTVVARTSEPATPKPAAEPEVVSEFAEGAKLIAASDCKSCHQEEIRVVGPAYVDVAEKYEFTEENVDYLAGKIIQGGSGVWGQVAMIPHPDLSEEDAKEMARYVLSLGKEE